VKQNVRRLLNEAAWQTKLGFYPLPVAEATRLKNCLVFPAEFSALDPCVGDGVASVHLLEGTQARRYGSEIDAYRAGQASGLGIDTVQADALDVRCPSESLSLLYLNPPYDAETGQTNNQRLELVFLEHTYRWLKPGGVLVFVIPQPQLRPCARILSEHFGGLWVYKLTEPASVQYQQVTVLAVRGKRRQIMRDSVLLESARRLETLASKGDLEFLPETLAARYEVPISGPVTCTNWSRETELVKAQTRFGRLSTENIKSCSRRRFLATLPPPPSGCQELCSIRRLTPRVRGEQPSIPGLSSSSDGGRNQGQVRGGRYGRLPRNRRRCSPRAKIRQNERNVSTPLPGPAWLRVASTSPSRGDLSEGVGN